MKTDIFSQQEIQERTSYTQAEQTGQYTFWQIIGIWALVALPMMLLAWVVTPAIIPYVPLESGFTFWLMMIAGMAWQFVVALVILYRELGTLRWGTVRKRLWLQTPLDPRTGQPKARLFWWLLPAGIFAALVGFGLAGYLEAPLAWLFPALKPASYMDGSQMASSEFQGQWWILGIVLISDAFNYFLGEEFLFRGILLPKMQGVFGKYDWVANSILFGLYHLHKPWSILNNIIVDMGSTWHARRFRSNWMAIAIHGAEGFMTMAIVLGVILGLLGRP